MKIKNIKSKVEQMLIKFPHLRDSDERLIACIWVEESGIQKKDIYAMSFLQLYVDKKLSSAESIRRSRQQLQEKNPELRGKSYTVRQTDQVEETQSKLGYGNQGKS